MIVSLLFRCWLEFWATPFPSLLEIELQESSGPGCVFFWEVRFTRIRSDKDLETTLQAQAVGILLFMGWGLLLYLIHLGNCKYLYNIPWRPSDSCLVPPWFLCRFCLVNNHEKLVF